MRHPPRRQEGDEAHAAAVEQLAEARERQRDVVDRAELAEGTRDEDQAERALEAGRNQIAAREAWVVWTERERF